MAVKMISRTLLIALYCATTLALSPLAPPNTVGDNSDCALYLNGPGRTSAYDYSINLLKGNFGYEGQPNCITFEAIDQAYLEARNRILVSQPKGDWGAEDFGSVGELILDISINLARRYGLTYEEIEKGLPLIDTSRTLIREVCPPVFSHVECRAGKYRRFDGLCNNLKNPTWGASMAPFQRLIGPLFADGINAPRIAHHGRDLPLSRVVSRTMHPDEGFHDHAGTVMVIAWGQFMDHDYTLTGTPLDPINRNDPEECCKRPLHLKHPYCNEIRIPDDDYFYRLFGVKCIDFVRAFPSPRPGCRLGSRVPFNTLTGSLDGNTVYGVTEKFARKLRTGFGGLLRMNPVFKEYGLKDLLPLKLDIPDEGCTRPNKNMYCFEAGEIRVNEQLVLTVMHTLMAREHNRVANALAEVNPHWDDETLFQEARRINIAEIQHITYNEFLPILLGKDVMEKFGLVLAKEGFWDGYDPDVNPDVIDSFAAAAYRFGHSLLPTAVERWSKAHKFIASKRLSDLIRRPYDLYRAGVLDEYVMGLMNQVAQAMDDSITQEVTNHLFKKVGARFGMDLVSFNMQRGREFGLPGYMEFRKFCGLPPAETFQDLFGSMPNTTVRKYETIFDHPVDVDLWSGGVSERPLPGSMLGPTFACIIATQFSYSRRGDRFWFELPNQPSSFTPEQLAEIRKSRLARIICDNTDIIDTTQLYPFVLPDHELNPRVPCRSGILPAMDFSKWAEPAPFHSSAKQFMTNATIFPNNSSTTEEVNKADNNQVIDLINNQTLETQDKLKLNNDTNITAVNLTIANNEKENNTSNDVPNHDTILKYVYKKDEKQEITKNNTGHPKNSLKRRKRSAVYEVGSPLPARVVNPSVIVNYETSHGPGQADAAWLPIKAGKIIPDTDLADFKIVTEHSNPRNNPDQSKNKEKESTEAENLSEASNESSEKEYKPNHDKGTYESEEKPEPRSGSQYKDNNRDSSAESNSDESVEVKADIKPKRPYPQDDSREQYENSGNKKLSRQLSRYNNNKRDSSTESNSDESADANSALKSKSPYSQDDSREQYDNNGNRKLSRQYSRYNNNKKHSSAESNSNESAESNSPIKTKQLYPKDDSRERYDSGENKKPLRQHSRYIDNKRDSSAELNSNESTERNSAIKTRHSYPHHDSSEQYNSTENKTSPDSIESDENSESNEGKNKIYNERQHLDKLKDIQAPEPKDQSYETQRPNIERPDLEKYPTESSAKQSSAESRAQNSEEETKSSLSQDQGYKKDAKYATVPIRDVDLGDFSYERIQVNEHGKVVPTKDSHDILDPKSAVELISSTIKPEFITPDFITPDFISLAIQTVPIITNDKLENNKLIQINDGEVKPVVEISNEEEPGSSEETGNTNNENSSLESVLGVEVLEDSNKENEKIVAQDNSKNEDIKQQVERIPLDYKHDKKENNVENVTQNSDPPNLDDASPTASIGTVDAFTPQDVPLDDKLNIKFDNLAFTLPEIKLPDDILAYTKLGSPFNEDEETQSKQRTYPYYGKKGKSHKSKNNEDDEDGHYYGHNEKIRKGNNEDDDDHSYYGPKQNIRTSNSDDDVNHEESDEDQNKGYYNYHEHVPTKEKYKKKDAEEEADEEEDLYEKFVRERFGKRGTFEKRNAKLEALPTNPKLYQTLQKILKKTADIDEQAKKSGDPNAGYMWTLEYGENL